MIYRWLRAFALASAVVFGAATLRAEAAAFVQGRVLDVDGGLPVSGAIVQLQRQAAVIARGTTEADGTFSISDVPGGTYTLRISKSGYETTLLPNFVVGDEGVAAMQTAIQRSAGEPQTIATVVSGASRLQTTTTLNANVDPTDIQSLGYTRAGDTLVSVPGVNTNTSSAVGDDLSISIRGFDPSETATLLDGHPIGPLGAFGSSFDYQASPFWGLHAVDVIYGSGATGVYGASTIAGAVDFKTLDPTLEPHGLITQGFGNQGHMLSGFQATGTRGKLGYALASAVQGTYGMFAPGQVTQTGNLGSINSNGYVDLTPATIAANTYSVTGNYVLRNSLGKLVYTFDPKTTLGFTAYNATTWDDKSGNGDTDNNPYAYVLYNTQQGLANGSIPSSAQLPSGATVTCPTGQIVALDGSTAGYSCLTAQQFSAATAGPRGGGPGPWQAIRNQDYHARLTRMVGTGQLVLDGFVDNYYLQYNRTEAGGGFNSDAFATRGYLVSDAYSLGKHGLSAGYYYQHQQHTGNAFPTTDVFGNTTNVLGPIGQYDLTSANYYIDDAYTPNLKLSLFGTFWFQHSYSTGTTNFDPRFTILVRPTNSDVVRLTAGRSYSEPDPFLINGPPSFNTTPTNLNPVCGAGPVNGIGSVSNANLVPETAEDVELAYGHRFRRGLTIQGDVYQAYESNALFSGTLPLSALGKTQVPPALIAQYLQIIDNTCHEGATVDNLGVSTTYNAASGRFRGIELAAHLPIGRNWSLDGDYDVQSASYLGVPADILQNNVTLIPGSQNAGTPLHKANVGLRYDGARFGARFDEHYIGDNNSYGQPAFWFANASLSAKFGPQKLTLGINNVFDTIAQSYGYYGIAPFVAENQYGTDTNAFQQGNEQFGLPYRRVFLSVTREF